MPVSIGALSYHLPPRVVTNAELAAENPAWDFRLIEPRSGVLSRHVAGPDETALDLAQAAAEKLFANDPTLRETLDGIVFCTQTPDHPMPPNACLLQARLGLRDDCAAFDITLGCSGFVYSLTIAEGLIAAGRAGRVLVLTGDTYSRLIHPADRAVRTLFGDGAAAVVVEPAADAAPGGLKLVDAALSTQGRHFQKFWIPAGGARRPAVGEDAMETVDASGNRRTPAHIHMDGLGVLGAVNSEVPRLIRRLLERRGLTLDDINLIVPHQGSRLALQSLTKVLRLDPARMVDNLAHLGNTVSASAPMALADARAAGRIKPGDRVLLATFGLGFSNAMALLEAQ